jgi:hypothetical protein
MAEQAESDGWVVKFVPFASTVDSPFWVQYNHEKLENIKLSTEPIPIRATFGVDGPPRLQCQESSLRMAAVVPNERVSVSGSLLGFNTLESFQQVDKNQLLLDSFLKKFLEGDASSLTSLLLLTFPDLKNHKVLYWFGMPAMMTKKNFSIRASQQSLLKDSWSEEDCKTLTSQVHSLRQSLVNDAFSYGLPPFFVRTKDRCESLDSKSLDRLGQVSLDEVTFGFFDPSGPSALQPEQPMGWPMRNLCAYLSFHLDLGGKTVQVLSYRPKRVRRITNEGAEDDYNDGDSVLLQVRIPKKEEYEWDVTEKSSSKYKVVGWELNARNKPGPRWVNLRPVSTIFLEMGAIFVCRRHVSFLF